jgi:hypothetical protein
MDYFHSTSKIDSIKCLRYYILTNNRRGLTSGAKDKSHFWSHPKFNRWQSQQQPALIMVKGDYKSRFEVKKFCISVVQMLRKSNMPVIWTLKPCQADGSDPLSVIDVVRDLVCQALRLNVSFRTERFLSLSCAQFRVAETEEQLFDLLAMIVATLPQLYIVVDIEAVDMSSANRTHVFSWFSAFQAMFQKLSSRQLNLVLKVVLVSYGSAAVHDIGISEFWDLVVLVRQPRSSSLFQGGKIGGLYRAGRTTALAGGRRTQGMTS